MKIDYDGAVLVFLPMNESYIEDYFDIINHNNQTIYLRYTNMIFEIEKTKDFSSNKSYITTLYQEEVNPIGTNTVSDEVYSLQELDTPPQHEYCSDLKDEFKADCLDNIIEDSILYFIDYHKIKNQEKLDISFLIDSQGNFQNLQVITDQKELIDDIKKGIEDLPKFKPGIKDDQPVHTDDIKIPITF